MGRQIDIRENVEEYIEDIIFKEDRWISKSEFGEVASIEDSFNMISIGTEADIDNLIKALQKAKEVWYS